MALTMLDVVGHDANKDHFVDFTESNSLTLSLSHTHTEHMDMDNVQNTKANFLITWFAELSVCLWATDFSDLLLSLLLLNSCI